MLKKLGKYYFQKKGYYPVNINGRKLKGDPYHIGFWRIVNKGGFEQEYFKILDKYLHKDSIYCDIGSWIGPTMMYASKLCKHIHAFEPDPFAFPFLTQNTQLNKLNNISAYNFAIGITDEDIKLASHGGNLGDSMSSMVNIEKLEDTITVPSMTWETWIKTNDPGKIDFIKMDVEGGEIELIPNMAPYLESEMPILHLSIHGHYLNVDTKTQDLERLFKSLLFYKSCLDENLNKIAIDSHLIKSCSDSFRSFLFMPGI